ncbi:hypothetical protein ABZX93_27085 [Streptomyces sp. NPDC006632]|uniref:hypothetical protein n=1 Tax=Streptomyces sp. NPDC006632 TaxID=3157182 RepID=UPI0033A1EF38
MSRASSQTPRRQQFLSLLGLVAALVVAVLVWIPNDYDLDRDLNAAYSTGRDNPR